MGAKRNTLVSMALKRYPEVEGVMLWDDDDCYFPHAMENVSGALEFKEWAQPRLALELPEGGDSLRWVRTHHRHDDPLGRGYGGCWAFRREEFVKAGMFAETNHSEDLKIAKIFLREYGDSADSSPIEPWYYYNRLNNSISSEGRNFYALRGEHVIKPVNELSVGWNGPDIFSMPIEPGVFPRPW
jgi:hypothetical protein